MIPPTTPLPATAKWHLLWVLPTLKSKCCPNRSPFSSRLKSCPIMKTTCWEMRSGECVKTSTSSFQAWMAVKAVMMSRSVSPAWPGTLNDAFNSAADLLSFMDSKWKNLYTEEHIPKPFASDELKYFQEVQERVKAIYKESQKVSNKLTTTIMSLKRKFPCRMGSNRQSRRKRENKRKVKTIRKDYISERICSRKNLPQNR